MRDHEIIGLQEAYLEVCEEGRSARRRKPSKSVEQLKAEISARDEAKAQRATERAAARKPLTPAERYEQEKSARKDKSSGFSQHRMTGSGGHGSEYRVSSRFREEFVINYLLDEGFASDEKSAEAILGAMSEAWVESIVEEFVDPEKGEAPSGRSPLENVSDHPSARVRRKAVKAFKKQMGKEYGGTWKSRSKDPNKD